MGLSGDTIVAPDIIIQKTYDNTAEAWKVLLVNSAGTVIKATQIEENRIGSELSGSDGATSRVLTLTNTSETGNPVSVWVESQLVSQSDFTPSHESSSSTITFGGIQIFDGDAIKILYYI